MADGHGGYRQPSHPAPVLRTCTRCLAPKPHSEFNRNRAGRPRSRCKPCQQDDYREYVAKGGDRVRALRRASKYRQRFNLPLEQVDALFEAAGHSCEICGIHRDATPNGVLVLDHDHACCPGEKTCGKCIRGVLCTKCNVGLGALDDDPLRAIALMDYITGKTGLEVRCG